MIHSKSNNENTGTPSGFPRLKLLVGLLSSCIALGLLIWSLLNYRPAPNFYGPRAIYSLIILSILLALIGRVLLLRMLRLESGETASVEAMRQRQRVEWRPLFLFDINAPLYLAAGALIGVPAAVLTALITQTVLQTHTFFRGFVSLAEACYRVAATALVVLISTMIYTWLSGPPQNYLTPIHYRPFAESKEFLGSILTAVIMMLLIALASLPLIIQVNRSNFNVTWREYLHSPALRFQALVLSVGPLLPVVDVFDDAGGELAWLFFLIPLFAIYYLALNSTQLSVRTSELQHTLQDLSSARQRQDELRNYASLITRVQEEERRRLARELHDDTAQALIALSLGLDGLRRAMGKLPLPEKDVQWLSNLQDLADHTLESVRRACRDLRPSVLDDLGLRAALEWLSDSSAERGVPCNFLCLGTPRPLSSEAEIAIFRIVQEALSNIWRHAGATHADIELNYLPNLLQVTIRDNGRGFTVAQYSWAKSGYRVANRQIATEKEESGTLVQYPNTRLLEAGRGEPGLGLLGMRERATLIGASLAITSAPEKGCSIILSLPV